VFQGVACREPAGQQDLAALCSRPDRSVKLVQYRLRGKRLVASHALKDRKKDCSIMFNASQTNNKANMIA